MKFIEALEFLKNGNYIFRKDDKSRKYFKFDDEDDIYVEFSDGDYEKLTNLTAIEFVTGNTVENKDIWEVEFMPENSIKGKTYTLDGKEYKTIQYCKNNLDSVLRYFVINKSDVLKSIRFWEEIYPERLSFVTPTKDVLIFQNGDYIVKSPTNVYFTLSKKQFREIFGDDM